MDYESDMKRFSDHANALAYAKEKGEFPTYKPLGILGLGMVAPCGAGFKFSTLPHKGATLLYEFFNRRHFMPQELQKPKFAPLTLDFTFKKAFANEQSTELLLFLINTFLAEKLKSPIKEVSIINNE